MVIKECFNFSICKKEFSSKNYRKQKFCSHICFLKNYKPARFKSGIVSPETRVKLRIASLKAGNKPPSHKGKTYKEIYGDRWKVEIEKRRVSHLRFFDKIGRREKYKNRHQGTMYITWRNSVFQKDNYTCMECGARSGNGVAVYLEAHHIKSWKNFKDLRYEVSNGLTLCKKCHLLHNKIQRKIENCGANIRSLINKDDKPYR